MSKIAADVLSIPGVHQCLHRIDLQAPRPPTDVEEVQSNDPSDARSRCPELDDLSTMRLVMEVGDGVGGLFEMGFLLHSQFLKQRRSARWRASTM